MTEFVKSWRMYKMSMQGLDKRSFRNHLWAMKNVTMYRRNRMQILKECELGYFRQSIILMRNVFRRSQGNKADQQQTQQDKGEEPLEGVKLNRVDYFKDMSEEKEYHRKKKINSMLFSLRMRIVSFYYGLNVQNFANKLSSFLKTYHDSLQSLVQGYREVTMDAKGEFKFEKDGMTVQEKIQAFENKLGEYSSGVTKEIKNSIGQKDEPKSIENKSEDKEQPKQDNQQDQLK